MKVAELRAELQGLKDDDEIKIDTQDGFLWEILAVEATDDNPNEVFFNCGKLPDETPFS